MCPITLQYFISPKKEEKIEIRLEEMLKDSC